MYSYQTPQKDPFAATELGMTCLRATVKLLERLELRSDSQGDESVNTVSRLFNKYSTALLGSIETCQAELAVSPFMATTLISQAKFHRHLKRPKKG
jgi:hypothetical protein